ncbi:hypothetical protein Save01_07020 [Streptomyces avermitilis]
MPMPKPLILLGAGPRVYSDFTLAQIAASRPVVLVDAFAPDWAHPYLTHHLAADPANSAAAIAAVRSYAAGHQVGGVLTYLPAHRLTAARIAQQLRLPAAPVMALAACADRLAARRLLAQHALPLARWAEACDASAAAAHADALGYPVVIKPRDGAVTMHVRNRGEVPSAYDHVCRAAACPASDSLLVEEDLEGPEVCAEAVVVDSTDIRVLAITRTTAGPPPARQVQRRSVYAHDKLLHHPVLRQVVTRAITALGLTAGVVHITMTCTSRGPRITDVNTHLPDDLIPLLVQRATGIDLPQIAADLATGRPPNLAPTRQRAAAVHFAYPSATGRIEHLKVTSATPQPLVDRFVLTQRPGQDVVSTPYASSWGRLAHCVAVGPDAATCHTTLDRMARHLTVALSTPVTNSRAA